jgi:hypothetical protein
MYANRQVAAVASNLPDFFRRVQSDRRWWFYLLVFVGITAIVISRQPQLAFNPQFWGDDAHWFADAYNNGGIQSVLRPQAGYLCLASKLPNILAVHVPLAFAPTIFGLYTIGISVLCYMSLLTNRFLGLGNLQARILLSFLWIAIPNCAEIYTLNNTQWILAVLGILILLCGAPRNKREMAFDLVIISLLSLTGPFCILMSPIGWLLWLLRRQRWSLILASLISAGAIVQSWTLLHFLDVCTPVSVMDPLGMKVLAGQVFLLGTLNGGYIIASTSLNSLGAAELATVVVIAGIVIVCYATIRGPLELRLFIGYACAVCLAAIRRLHCDSGWDWESMMNVYYAVRYWYIPRLAVLSILVWMLGPMRTAAIRVSAALAIVLIVAASFSHWQYTPWQDLHFLQYARVFDSSPKGSRMTIPVNPVGWSLTLVKR